MKILVIRFSSIGDIVLTSPVLRCLKQQLPDAEIDFCTKQKFSWLVAPNPFVGKVLTLDDSLIALRNQIAAGKYDVIVDLHNNLRSRLLTAMLPAVRCLRFRKENAAKRKLVATHGKSAPVSHVVHRYMHAVASLGVVYDGKGLDFFYPADSDLDAATLSSLPSQKFVAFAAGGTHATKRLPANKIAELLIAAPMPVVILGDKTDRIAAEQAASGLQNKVLNLCGMLSFGQSARVLEAADVVLTHDTGLMHVAAAMKKPVVSIWGNTIPGFGMSAFYPDGTEIRREVAEVDGLNCRPCSRIGYAQCPKGHFKCMQLQDVNGIVSHLSRP